MQHVFVFLSRDDLVGQTRGAAHGHQQKDVPGRRADALTELEDFFEAAQVVAGDGGVDLKGHARGFEVFYTPQAGFKSAGHAAEAVVAGRVRSIDGDGAAVDPGGLDSGRRFRGDEGAVGRKGAGQALGVGISYQLVDVGPHHGVAAREDDDGTAHLGEGVDKGLGLGCGKFAGVGLRMGLGPAVLTGQVAGAGHFPGNEPAHGAAVRQGGGSALVRALVRFGMSACSVSAGMPGQSRRPFLSGGRNIGQVAGGVAAQAWGGAVVGHQRTSLSLSRVSVK